MNTNDYSGIADLYDTYVPVDFDIPFFIEETKKINGPVLELMAGTGRVSLPLIQAGINLTCEDSSADMLNTLGEKAKALGFSPRLVPVDVCRLNLEEKFQAVIIPFNSFAHLVTPVEQKEALRRIAAHLVPGGVFICTLSNPRVRSQSIDGQLRLFRRYPLPKTGGELLLWLLEKKSIDDPKVIETSEFFEEYDKDGIMIRRSLMELRFRLFEREEFELLIQSTGFKVETFFGDYSKEEFKEDSSRFMIWKLRYSPEMVEKQPINSG